MNAFQICPHTAHLCLKLNHERKHRIVLEPRFTVVGRNQFTYFLVRKHSKYKCKCTSHRVAFYGRTLMSSTRAIILGVFAGAAYRAIAIRTNKDTATRKSPPGRKRLTDVWPPAKYCAFGTRWRVWQQIYK